MTDEVSKQADTWFRRGMSPPPREKPTEGGEDLEAARGRIGRETGLSQTMVARLKGGTAAELEQDAADLISEVREARGEPASAVVDKAWRAAAGRGSPQDQSPEPEQRRTSMDGGVREMVSTPPTFGSVIEAERELRQREAGQLARIVDQHVKHGVHLPKPD